MNAVVFEGITAHGIDIKDMSVFLTKFISYLAKDLDPELKTLLADRAKQYVKDRVRVCTLGDRK